MECPGCRTANPEGHRFCMSCGAALERVCPSCGAPALPQARFCGSCGSPLEKVPPPKPEPSPEDKLARYMPQRLAEKILATRGRIEGERRQVTVLFCDLAGSTRIAERIDPEDYRQLLNDYLEHSIHCIHRYEGVISQFAGDGFMAIFGAPIAHDDDAARASRAALDLMAELRVLSRDWQERIGQPLAARIGMNTGPVIVGTVGNDLRMEYAAVGDTTNVASRIEAYAPSGGIYLSEATRKLVAHSFETEEVATQAFKGKETKTTVFRLIREIPTRERRHQALRGGLSRFYGRHTELALLRERYEEARSGAGQVVFIEGEAGIGKSRLVYEFRRQLDSESYHWLEGQGVSYGTRSSYLPIIDLLRGVFEIDESDSTETIIEKVVRRCAAMGDPVAAGEPFYRDLLSVDPGDKRLEGMWESHRMGFIFESVRDLVHTLAQDRPVVMLVEDIHWIDESSEQLLRRFLDTLAAAPILVLVTHRSEYTWPHGERSYFSRVRLHGLSAPLVDELAENVLGRSDLPVPLKRVIAERSDGNPFFVEEVSKALKERGILEQDLSGATLGDEVPSTVQEVLLARIDRLEEEAKRTLQIASVIGREFTVRVLERLAEREDDSSSALDKLRALELIYEKSVYPELAYMFKHALTHDVAYQTLLHSQRRELHREVAGLIEELYADRLPEFYETLAYQYREAEIPERAAHYALLSGERAAKHLAPEAEHHFRQAVDLSHGRDDCKDIFIKAQAGWGDLLNLQGRIDDANNAYTEAIETTSDPEKIRWLQNKIAHRYFVRRGDVRLAYYIQGHGAGGDPARTVPIMFLHPLIQGSYSFEVIAQRLCQEYCVVFVDPRGTGASDKPIEDYDFDTRTEDMLAIVKQLPYDRFILNGDSDGVPLALRLYQAIPERVEKMVLFGFAVVGPYGPDNPLGVRDEEKDRFSDLILRQEYRTALTNFCYLMTNEPGLSAWREIMVDDWEKDIDEPTFKGFMKDAVDSDERHLLPGIEVPTLVIAAERDIATVERVRYMADHIPGAQFALIKGASHAAPWSAVETFLEIMTTFIDQGTLPQEVWEP